MPVIYAWNEALGVGNHVAYFQYGNAGCYECLFKRDEDNEELYDRTSYCEHGQDVVQKVAGCGSAFIPYGSTVSIKTATFYIGVFLSFLACIIFLILCIREKNRK